MLQRLSILPAVALLLAGVVPAGAAEVDPATDHLLWCSSAFYWLAGNAYDSKADREAKQYETFSTTLMDQAIAGLRTAGKTDDEIQALVSGYDDKVLDQIGAPDAPYDVTGCPELVQAKPDGK